MSRIRKFGQKNKKFPDSRTEKCHFLSYVSTVVAKPLLLLQKKPPPELYKSPGPPPPKLALKKLYGWELYGC